MNPETVLVAITIGSVVVAAVLGSVCLFLYLKLREANSIANSMEKNFRSEQGEAISRQIKLDETRRMIGLLAQAIWNERHHHSTNGIKPDDLPNDMIVVYPGAESLALDDKKLLRIRRVKDDDRGRCLEAEVISHQI